MPRKTANAIAPQPSARSPTNRSVASRSSNQGQDFFLNLINYELFF